MTRALKQKTLAASVLTALVALLPSVSLAFPADKECKDQDHPGGGVDCRDIDVPEKGHYCVNADSDAWKIRHAPDKSVWATKSDIPLAPMGSSAACASATLFDGKSVNIVRNADDSFTMTIGSTKVPMELESGNRWLKSTAKTDGYDWFVMIRDGKGNKLKKFVYVAAYKDKGDGVCTAEEPDQNGNAKSWDPDKDKCPPGAAAQSDVGGGGEKK